MPISERELQITYRQGRALAAYLYLSHDVERKSARPFGVEIVTPQAVTLERLNQLLTEIGEAPMAEQEYGPLRVA
jgi:hypothetical protein